MTQFEPQSTDMIGEWHVRLERLQREYSDEELLIELRRRGRLARVEAEFVVPQMYVDDGLPIEMQIKDAWKQFAYEAARLHVSGTKPTGAKVDTVVGDGFTRSPLERSRRVSFAVNYVVDRYRPHPHRAGVTPCPITQT